MKFKFDKKKGKKEIVANYVSCQQVYEWLHEKLLKMMLLINLSNYLLVDLVKIVLINHSYLKLSDFSILNYFIN